jgi:hypothetical protein
VTFEAVGHGVQELRPPARADPAKQICADEIDRENVVAIHLLAGHADRRGARQRTLARRHRIGRGGGRPAIVLAHEQHRQGMDRRPVESFEERTAVHRAVAEEAHHQPVFPPELHRVGCADRNRDAGGDDPVGAQHADREVGDVHRAALAAVEAAGAAEQLAHHALHGSALGERMAVAAMRRRDVVVRRQVDADARGDRLLAGGQVQRAADLRLGERRAEGGDAAARCLLGGVLEGADARHRAVERCGALRRDRREAQAAAV